MITLTREEAQELLDALKHLCLYTAAIKGYNGHKVQPPINMLKAKLKQPDVPETDFGKIKPVPIAKLRELVEIQGRNGTWNYDPYFHGMYNGMEVMLAVLEDREPVFRGAPKKWLSKKEWQGLTDEEVKILATQGRTDFSRPAYNEFYSAIEAKLKEKNA